jgi:hypothetical protein
VLTAIASTGSTVCAVTVAASASPRAYALEMRQYCCFYHLPIELTKAPSATPYCAVPPLAGNLAPKAMLGFGAPLGAAPTAAQIASKHAQYMPDSVSQIMRLTLIAPVDEVDGVRHRRRRASGQSQKEDKVALHVGRLWLCWIGLDGDVAGLLIFLEA